MVSRGEELGLGFPSRPFASVHDHDDRGWLRLRQDHSKCNIEYRQRRMSATTSYIGTGFEYPQVPVSWTKRDVILFAWSIGCTDEDLQFLYVRVFEYPT
jgi:hypothetical protein